MNAFQREGEETLVDVGVALIHTKREARFLHDSSSHYRQPPRHLTGIVVIIRRLSAAGA